MSSLPSLDVAVIVISWNVRNFLGECLRSTLNELAQAKLRGKIWVVDNHSTDGSAEMVRTFFDSSRVELIVNQENQGFGRANNQGMQLALSHHPRYFFLLNPDTVVRPNSIAHLVKWLDTHPRAGIAGPRLAYGNGRFQHSAFQFPGLRQLLFEFLPLPHRLYETRLNGRYPQHWYQSRRPFPIDHPLGAAMLVRREVYEQTGGFDEAFHMYCEEIDWAWRVRQRGWLNYTVPEALITHFGGESSKQMPAHTIINLWASRAQLYRKYYSSWKIRLANNIVRNGLLHRARTAPNAELQKAYQQAAALWQ